MQQQQDPAPADPDPLPPPDLGDAAASSATQTIPSRNASSKYDFVKVKVWLGENADHYYVLSRFLLSRMLTVTKIPNHVAIKIALELKKLLVDNSLLDVSQSDLEANLFKVRFHHQRVPLVILVCGTACTGKSTIATQLAQRLNLPNVLQTDMVAPLTSVPVWARDFNSPEELITEFCRECRVVRKGLAGDLKKAMKDGKPIIIEGIHLDPSIYLMDEEKSDGNSRTEKTVTDSENPGISVERKVEHQFKNGLAENRMDSTEDNKNFVKSKKSTLEKGRTSEGLSYAQNHETKVHDSARSQEKNPKDESDGHKDLDQQKNNATKKDKPAAEPIIVPIVLRMSDFDHKALLEEWIATRAFRDNCIPQGLTIVDISANSFPQTLDWLHSYLLQCIERGLLAACLESCNQGQ
ncbi:P-loop containing nucleoside triphosphate hydrolase superfamily protein [Zea mays]|uniref:p-loop containing nucleoside triphosphate hydrolase superfamily protein n=1 Tax=Zea mays TaxID=4577 RepID=A0A1D6PM82_MAIZE|nr:P-loop containing nucleoside triphosphate hydrolase superfamily protein [Zea mays]AQL10250.1 P-loop containing nucleoside triphosphate hydrolase superfamily protein [Zea mays]